MTCVFEALQFRLGKTRNVNLSGYYLRDMPVFRRDDLLSNMHEAYTCHMLLQHPDEIPLGKHSFNTVVNTLCIETKEVSACSYFYVDFLDLNDLVMERRERMGTIHNGMCEYATVDGKPKPCKNFAMCVRARSLSASLCLSLCLCLYLSLILGPILWILRAL